MIPRPVLPARLLAAAVTGTVAITLAACSGGGGSPAAGASPHAATVSAATALTVAAGRARRATSFSATIDSTTSGAGATRLHGTLAEQIKPSLLVHEKLAVTAAGTAVPGGIEMLFTTSALYLKMSSLSRMTGKPWIKIPLSSLKSASGVNFAALFRQVQTSSPLSFIQMLPAATAIHRTGTATVGGIRTTGYTGTLNLVKGLARLAPGLRKLVSQAIATTGLKTDRFTVWVDSHYLVRKLTQVQTGSHYRARTVMVVTAINQPLHIQLPPAGQTALMPGS